MFFFIIPILGIIKNIVKYKRFSLILFIRTPLICYLFKFIDISFIHLNLNNWQISLLERHFMFLYKIFYSLLTNSYEKKKNKYLVKYNL